MGEQARYQVRFDWGAAGAVAIGTDAHVLVWVDALDPVAPPGDLLPATCEVLACGLDDAAAAAARVLAIQERRQDRTTVAVVAAGSPRAGGLRFAVEDLLAAGAVLDALEERGIDAMSPEAAAADAAWRGLRSGVRAMLAAAVGAG